MPKPSQSEEHTSAKLTKKLNSDPLKPQLKEKSSARRKKQAAKTNMNAEAGRTTRNDLQPTLKIIEVPICELNPSPTRVRITTASQIEKVIRSLRTFGQVLPVLIDANREIISGHTVCEASTKLGLVKVSCVQIEHLSEPEAEALSITLNRAGETGSWDLDLLSKRLVILEGKGIELTSTGFDLPEIDQITIAGCSDYPDTSDPAGEEGADDFTPMVEIGDIFKLGSHRLVCGDALELSSYELALDGQKAEMIISDPPYNLPIKGFVSGLGEHKHDDFDQAVGEMSGGEFQKFLSTYLGHCKVSSSTGAIISAFMDWRQIEKLIIAGESQGLTRKNIVVWNKGSGGMGSLYRSAHELNVVFCNGKSPATNNVELGRHGRDRTNVWSYPGANSPGTSAAKALADHPTPKNVAMIEDAILDVTKRGGIILDPFLGSGTTMIAAERTHRICCGIELDPKYVDRAIRRWQDMTGQPAIHISSAMTFDDLNDARASEKESSND